MNRAWGLVVLLWAGSAAAGEPAAPRLASFLGIWSGTVSHAGETQPFALELENVEGGKIALTATIPAIHCVECALGNSVPQLRGAELRLGPVTLTLDAQADTLSGTVPEGMVPVYRIPFTLRRVARLDFPPRPDPSGPFAKPAWTFDAGSPLWAGASFAEGLVYAGGDDGRLHALDAATGQERWVFRAGGPIRTRATPSGGALYFQADDGFLYRLVAATGKEEWRVRVVDRAIRRLPFEDPKSRYDRFGSDVTVAADRLYLGTHDGKLLVLAAATGSRIWEFSAGDSVLAAPSVIAGRIYFGSYDHFVYALDAETGRLIWKYDTRGAVVSTPAVDPKANLVVIGSRSYDLFGLDAATGQPAWQRYIWFSWVESSVTLRDGVAYVGSSDAAAACAFDVASGRSLWSADTYGWTWGQPAVTSDRVYVSAASLRDYGPGHRAGVLALERASGRPVWRYIPEPPSAGTYGFPGSPAVGAGLLFVTGLDGKVYAFPL
jgi:outer membrane protein assembly factor BamB